MLGVLWALRRGCCGCCGSCGRCGEGVADDAGGELLVWRVLQGAVGASGSCKGLWVLRDKVLHQEIWAG